MKVNELNFENAVESNLVSLLANNKFPHAIMLEGGTAEKRQQLADIVARALLCSDTEEIPCGKCKHCKKGLAKAHPDIKIYFPEKKEGTKTVQYSIDKIREIRDATAIIPNEADKYAFILNDAHLMNEQGQNALLKILEEPPKYVHFILLCSSKTLFIETILSRVPCYSLGENTSFNEYEVSHDQALSAANRFAEAILKHDDFEKLKAAGAFDKNKKLLTASLEILSEILADALKMKYLQNDDKDNLSSKLSYNFSADFLLKEFDNCQKIQKELKDNANVNLAVTRLVSLL